MQIQAIDKIVNQIWTLTRKYRVYNGYQSFQWNDIVIDIHIQFKNVCFHVVIYIVFACNIANCCHIIRLSAIFSRIFYLVDLLFI